MALEIVRANPSHFPEITGILFDAFKGIQERHRFPLDIPTLEIAGRLTGMFLHSPTVYGVTAVLDGRIVGSNFVSIADPVASIGPITVDPACQDKGIGRALMRHITEWALKNHGPMVRLVQEAFNIRSLALYTSLGFTVTEPLLLMELFPAKAADPTVRELKAGDFAACDELCRRVTRVSRKNELAFLTEHGAQGGFTPFGRFVDGKLLAYVVPGFLGHGVAETAEDLLTTAVQAARHMPEPSHRLFVPVRNGELFRRALSMGMRGMKPMSLMAMGPYEAEVGAEGTAAWIPSIGY